MQESLCRASLAESDVEKLEAQWMLLDELWMSVRHYIQVVHDIEYGYGDPLRTKASCCTRAALCRQQSRPQPFLYALS